MSSQNQSGFETNHIIFLSLSCCGCREIGCSYSVLQCCINCSINGRPIPLEKAT